MKPQIFLWDGGRDDLKLRPRHEQLWLADDLWRAEEDKSEREPLRILIPGHRFYWKFDGDISYYINMKILTYIVYTESVLRKIVGQCGLDVKCPVQACVFVDPVP